MSQLPARPTPIHALVPCAGVGERAGAGRPKQYATVAGKPMVAHTLQALAKVDQITSILVVLAPDDTGFDEAMPGFAGPRHWVLQRGGASRAETVANGLAELCARGAGDDDWVLVHDAARCLLRPEWVERLIEACGDDAVGGLLALPLADTLKHEVGGRAHATLDRRDKWLAQTPQMFRLGLLQRALAAALAKEASAITDEASAIEALGLQPRLVLGDAQNFKLTYPADFALAEQLLGKRPAMTPGMRIGEGWDIHALVLGRPLILGGITIPHSHGLLGHSDADALLHAITDALLGAAGLGDIGRHFPDTDPAYKGADSLHLLAEAARRVRAAGWAINNIDATIVAQAPKLAGFIPVMCERISATLGLPAGLVNVKAKTAEKMGPVGAGQAIEARAICMLIQSKQETT